jgi:tetratricopeptide (TPR) repeat protein
MVNTPREKGFGHAFAIGDGSLLLAARHVVFTGNDTSEFETLGLLTIFSPYLGELREARVVADDPDSDIAILRWNGKGHPALAVAGDAEIRAANEMQIPAFFDLGAALAENDERATTRPATAQLEDLDVDYVGLRGDILRSINMKRKGFKVQKGWSGAPAILPGTSKAAGVVVTVRTRGGQPAAVEAAPISRIHQLLVEQQAATQPSRPTTRPADAEAVFGKTVELWIAVSRKDRTGAVARLHELIAARPGNSEYRARLAVMSEQLGDPNTDALYKEAIAREGGTLESRVYYSQYLIDQGRYDDALAVLKELRTAEPRGTLWALGWYNAHEKQRKQAEVVDALKDAVKIAPNDGLVWINLGQAQHAAKDDRAAVESYERAVALVPRMHEVRMLLAQSLDANGQTARAETMFRDWVRDQPDNSTAHLLLAQFLARQGPGHLYEALHEAESALALPAKEGAPPPQIIKALADRIRGQLERVPGSQPATRPATGPTQHRATSKPSTQFRL